MMSIGKTLLLAAVLAAAPLAGSAASAQVQHNPMTAMPRDRTMTTDRATTLRDRQDMRDMRFRDRRDMRHFGWRNGHHFGWRHCMMRWHHHHHVRVCR
jgi:Ni/Co efflux regulator RcnB